MTYDKIDQDGEHWVFQYVTLHVSTSFAQSGYTISVNGNREITGLDRDQTKAVNEAIRHAVELAIARKETEIRNALGIRP